MSTPILARFVIGTYTECLPHVDGKAAGILSASWKSAHLDVPVLVAPARNPSFAAVTSDRRYLYAVNETVSFGGQPGGAVTSYARNPETGALRELNSASSRGVEPAHIALDPSEKFVLVANYRSGSVTVFARAEDGSLGAQTSHVQHAGSSVHPVRQTGPHAHMIAFDPVTGEVLVPDLGLDAVLVYQLSHTGKLVERERARIRTASGAGPRHLAFHPRGEFLFLVSELDNTLTALRRRADRFEPTATVSTLPASFSEHSQAAAVRVSPSGRYVYASNRGEASDSIAMIRFSESTGGLELAHLSSSQGREPRDIVVTGCGRYLLAANQDSDTVVVFEVDEDAPSLRAVSSVSVPTPVCLVAA